MSASVSKQLADARKRPGEAEVVEGDPEPTITEVQITEGSERLATGSGSPEHLKRRNGYRKRDWGTRVGNDPAGRAQELSRAANFPQSSLDVTNFAL